MFDLWAKTIAIELIRQTPLFAVKYLDILTLAQCWNKKKEAVEQDWNYNYVNADPESLPPCDLCSKQPIPPPRLHRGSARTDVNSNDTKTLDLHKSIDVVDSRVPVNNEEFTVDVLLKKCQSTEVGIFTRIIIYNHLNESYYQRFTFQNYVPVRDKLVLFESLCRLSRKVRSTEDVSLRQDVSTKRALSMHDLSGLSTPGVKQICQYFENKTEQKPSSKYGTINRANRRLVNSDSQLHYVQNTRYSRNPIQLGSYA